MPWMETDAVDQRLRLVVQAAQGMLSKAALCRRFGISRNTAYRWIERYRQNPGAPLVDRSHAPLTAPHALSSDVITAILGMKARYPTWGPRKILARLRQDGCALNLPAASTAGRLLSEHGLVRPRRQRHKRVYATSGALAPVSEPNGTWCMDFKGQFELRRDGLCYPLTITDAFSRYLLCCEALPGTGEGAARKAVERCFRTYGLPETVRTDNGTPFSTNTLSGLSSLAVWWVRLGIKPERIEVGRPDQNGRHERMHRTLKEDVVAQPAATFCEQQRAFDRYRVVFNNERPHQALADATPATLYRPSARQYPRRLPELEYPSHYFERRVDSGGVLNWLSKRVYLSTCLAREIVGIEERPDGLWTVHFGHLQLGVLDSAGTLTAPQRTYRRSQRRRGSDAV